MIRGLRIRFPTASSLTALFGAVAVVGQAATPYATASPTLAAARGTITIDGRDASISNSSIGDVIETLTVTNDLGVTQPAHGITDSILIPFPKGVLPAGTYPKFELSDGTPVPFTMGEPTTNPEDGSLHMASFLFRIPVSLTAGQTINLIAKTAGTAPAAATVTEATAAAASDLKVEIRGIVNLTGTWTSAVNQGITDGHVDVFADGPVGKWVRVLQEFNDGSTDNPQLECWHYVQILQNESGGLYGIRHMPKPTNGWYASSGPQAIGTNPVTNKYVDNCAVKNGAATVRTVEPSFAPVTFTMLPSGAATVVTGSTMSVPSVTNWYTGMPAKLVVTGGTAHGGLTSGGTYFVRMGTGTQFTLHTSQNGAAENFDTVTITSSGTGTNTIYPAAALLGTPDPRGNDRENKACQVTTTGTLPADLVGAAAAQGGTMVWLYHVTDSVVTIHSNIVGSNFGNNSWIYPTSAGTGTHTFTPRLEIGIRRAPMWPQSNAKYTFVQAGGSGSDAQLRVTVPIDYFLACQAYPPVPASGLTVNANATRTMFVDGLQDVYAAESSGGDRVDIGILTGWCYRNFLRSNADLQTIRVYASQQAQKRRTSRRKETRNIINSGNTSFTGLGTPTPNYFFGGNPAGDVNSNAPFERTTQRGEDAIDHGPHFQAAAYLATGEPQYLDMLHDGAQTFIGGAAFNRQRTVSATTYYNMVFGEDQLRTGAWTLRDIAWAAMVTPDNYMGTQNRAYFKKTLEDNMSWAAAYRASAATTTFARDIAAPPHTAGPNIGIFMQVYWNLTACLIHQALRTTQSREWLEQQMTWLNNIRTNVGLWNLGTYYSYYRTNPTQVNSWLDVVFMGNYVQNDGPLNLTVDATGLFTSNHDTTKAGTLTDGQPIYWQFPPPGVSPDTRYYLRDVSGLNFRIAATPGGTAIVTGSSGSTGMYTAGWLPGASATEMMPQAPFSIADFPAGKIPPVGLRAGVRWAKALGVTLPSGLESAIETYINTKGALNHADDPNYSLVASFPTYP